VIVETFKVKVCLAVSRHFPAQPFCPVLVLAFAWQLFSSLHLRLAPFLDSSFVLQFHNWSFGIKTTTKRREKEINEKKKRKEEKKKNKSKRNYKKTTSYCKEQDWKFAI
jgi:hypothetical protein